MLGDRYSIAHLCSVVNRYLVVFLFFLQLSLRSRSTTSIPLIRPPVPTGAVVLPALRLIVSTAASSAPVAVFYLRPHVYRRSAWFSPPMDRSALGTYSGNGNPSRIRRSISRWLASFIWSRHVVHTISAHERLWHRVHSLRIVFSILSLILRP